MTAKEIINYISDRRQILLQAAEMEKFKAFRSGVDTTIMQSDYKVRAGELAWILHNIKGNKNDNATTTT